MPSSSSLPRLSIPPLLSLLSPLVFPTLPPYANNAVIDNQGQKRRHSFSSFWITFFFFFFEGESFGGEGKGSGSIREDLKSSSMVATEIVYKISFLNKLKIAIILGARASSVTGRPFSIFQRAFSYFSISSSF